MQLHTLYMFVSRLLACIYYYWLTDLQSTVKHHMYKRHLAGKTSFQRGLYERCW